MTFGLVALWAAGASLARAEVVEPPARLPPIIPNDSIFAPAERRPERVAMNTPPAEAAMDYAPYPEHIRPVEPFPQVYLDERGRAISRPMPPTIKPQVFQGVNIRKTWIPGHAGNTMGIASVAVEAVFASPWLVAGAAPLVTPFFTGHYLEGPYTPNMPGHLFDGGVEFRWLKQVRPRLGVDFAVAPAVFSDFNNSRADQWRVVGRGLITYDFTPEWQAVAGGSYLGRQDIPALPIVGVVWSPDDDTRIEAVFPRPRAARRVIPPTFIDQLAYSPLGPWLALSPEQEHWLYVLGELGGNTYAIRTATGGDDRVTYNDFRLIFGWERRGGTTISARAELGYVFNRYLDYVSNPGHDYLHDGWIMRGEVAH